MLYANQTLINKLMKNCLPSTLKKKKKDSFSHSQFTEGALHMTQHSSTYIVSFQKLFL